MTRRIQPTITIPSVLTYPRRMADTAGGVAAFDFDGTISRRDTFLPFLQRVCGAQRVYRALARCAPASRLGRDAWVGAVLLHLRAGHPSGELEQAGEDYASFLLEGGRLRP